MEVAPARKQFDQPFVFERARPLTSAERSQERKLRRGRPKIGKGAKKVSISLESKLLREADALARKRGMNRSQLIAGSAGSLARRQTSERTHRQAFSTF